jgi:hypothetical protein
LDCVVSAARAQGAGGLLSGRLKALGADSVSVRLRIHWLQNDKQAVSDVQDRAPKNFSVNLLDNFPQKLIAKLMGKPQPQVQSADTLAVSYISVQTEPEGAVLMHRAGETICETPCVFAYAEREPLSLAAYYRVEGNLWAAVSETRPVPGDTTKIYMALHRASPAIELRSEPLGATVFPSGALAASSKALGTTPFVIKGIDPGPLSVRLWKIGYQDTLLHLNLDALDKTVATPKLAALTDPELIAQQQSFAKERRNRNIGWGLAIGSLGFLGAGTGLVVSAQDDYSEARRIKRDLESFPSIGDGPNWNAQVNANHRAVKRGDTKLYAGLGSFAIFAVLASVGGALIF